MLFQIDHQVTSRVDIGVGLRQRAGTILKQVTTGGKALIISQASLPGDWLQELKDSIAQEGFTLHTLQLAEGEAGKSSNELLRIWACLETAGFGRKDCIIAIGGGAVTDAAGFAASTYLRGIKLLLVPTTLLSQVDAAIGGKTAINLDSGKNLAGSFYFPHAVLIDPDYLRTLPERELKSGMGEIIKYALIENTVAKETEYKRGPIPLLKVLESNFPNGIETSNPALLSVIACCVKMKLQVVLSDPHEEGLRRCLNLGHTLGHAIEKVSDYKISHGEAVAIGCLFALDLAIKHNFIEPEQRSRLKDLIASQGLASNCPSELESSKLFRAMTHDKKREGGSIKFILPKNELGTVTIDYEAQLNELQEFLNQTTK